MFPALEKTCSHGTNVAGMPRYGCFPVLWKWSTICCFPVLWKWSTVCCFSGIILEEGCLRFQATTKSKVVASTQMVHEGTRRAVVGEYFLAVHVNDTFLVNFSAGIFCKDKIPAHEPARILEIPKGNPVNEKQRTCETCAQSTNKCR